jgi:hypothetical protein
VGRDNTNNFKDVHPRASSTCTAEPDGDGRRRGGRVASYCARSASTAMHFLAARLSGNSKGKALEQPARKAPSGARLYPTERGEGKREVPRPQRVPTRIVSASGFGCFPFDRAVRLGYKRSPMRRRAVALGAGRFHGPDVFKWRRRQKLLAGPMCCPCTPPTSRSTPGRSRNTSAVGTFVRATIDQTLPKQQSPTTTEFFNLDDIQNEGHPAHRRFRAVLHQVLGIR